MTNMPFTSINDIAAVLDDAMDFEASLTTTTAATSLDSTPAAATTTAATTTAATTTAATTTAATTTGATTTAITTYTPSSDISTIASDPSPVTLSSETLSHLSREFFANRPVGLLQEAVEIAAWELAAQSHANFMIEIYDLFRDIRDAANAEVAWLANFAERNLDSKKLKYKRYNDFLKALDSSGRVKEMIKQHHTAQHRKIRATKKLGNLWQHYPELQEILRDSSRSEKWMRLTVIANQTSRDPGLAKRCLNLAYVNRLTKLNHKSKANKWYTSGDFQEAKKLLDNGGPQLEEGINNEAMGLKWYRVLVMPLSYYPGMDDRNNANWLRTISPSVPPADHGIPRADHGIPVPPPSPDKSKMFPPPTPSINGKETEKDASNVEGLLIDLAEGGSEDGTSTPTEKDAGTVPPATTEIGAGTTPPAPTGEEAGTTPDKPTDPKQKGTPKPDRPATPGSESSCSDDDDTEDEEYVRCLLEWLDLDPDCKKMMDYEMKMLAHHERKMGNQAVHIFQQAVNEDPELFTEARAQITAAGYAMR